MELLIGGNQQPVMLSALDQLIRPATRVSLAVSFLQVSGWQLLRPLISNAALNTMRVVCDDKMGITHPDAVRRMLAEGVDVRAYNEGRVYHPKVYLAQSQQHPHRALLGSANLSEPALKRSVEVGVFIDDPQAKLAHWFDDLFANETAPFDDARLGVLDVLFRKRLKGELVARETQAATIESGAALIDRIFSSLGPYVAPLSFDQGKNNVRNLVKAWELTKLAPQNWSDVQEDELRFSGLAIGRNLTPLGHDVAQAPTISEVVDLWVAWLKGTPPAQLPQRKFDNLAIAKRAFDSFWHLQESVRDFFLQRSVLNQVADRPVLQAIELLANAGTVGEELSLSEVQALAPLLTNPNQFPSAVSKAVRSYIDNKASRTWGYPERRLIMEAWREA